MTAKAEAVRHHVGERFASGFVGNVVEIAVGIGIFEVDRGGHDLTLEGQDRDHELDPTRGPQQVSQLALGARDRDAAGFAVEDGLDCHSFGLVAQRSAGAVGVDVVNLAGVEAGVLQGELHGASRAPPFRVGSGHVVAVGAQTVAHHLSEDGGATAAGVFVLFEDDHASPLRHDEPVAIAVEGPTGAVGGVIASRQGAHAGEAREPHRGDGGLAAPGDHDVGAVRPNEVERIANRV